MTTVDNLLTRYRMARGEDERAAELHARTRRNAYVAELAVLDALGMGAGPHAEWIRAALESRHDDCHRILTSEEYAAESPRYLHEVHMLSRSEERATVQVAECCGIPVYVDADTGPVDKHGPEYEGDPAAGDTFRIDAA